MIPPLSDLLTENTVIVLGAGASKDYGFPLWEQLRDDLLDLFRDDHFERIFNKGNPGVNWWINALNNMTDADNVDTLARGAPTDLRDPDTNEPVNCYDLFRVAAAIVIARYEERDKVNSAWIEVLSQKYLALLRTNHKDAESIKQLAQNLTVVTLNYDRVFDVRFGPIVAKGFENILEPREYEKKYKPVFRRTLRILHPHGCIGDTRCTYGSTEYNTYLNHGRANNPVSYGDVDRIYIRAVKRISPDIAPVDDLIGARNPTYDKANTLLGAAKNCLCIGLSRPGIEASLLKMELPDVVYYSGSEKVKDNFVPVKMYASDLVECL